MSFVKKESEIKIEYFDLRHIPDKYKNMSQEEKEHHFHVLNEQMKSGLLNNYEIGEFLGLCYILLKEEGIF